MIGRGHIDIEISPDDIQNVVGKMHELEFEDIMVCEFGIDFELVGKNSIEYTSTYKLRDWLNEEGYSFSINVDEWYLSETGGYYYDSDDDNVEEDVK